MGGVDVKTMTRREVLKGSAAAGLVVGVPGMLSAQAKAPINIGTLCPLTGAGGSYGPDMQRAVVAVVERINKAGGIHGRPVQLFHEDDETSAEAGVRAAGVTITDDLIYEDKKPSYRSEVTRILATNPDLIMLEGYTPDSVVMAKDIYKAGYKGAVLAPSFAVNAKFIEGASAEVSEGIWNMDRAPLFDSPAYKDFSAAVPRNDTSPYAPQAWDQMSIVALALAAGKGEASGTVIKDNLRAVANPPGTVVYTFAEGAKLLGEGKKINYEGASGACDFDAIGDILSAPFAVQQVRKGKSELVTIINP